MKKEISKNRRGQRSKDTRTGVVLSVCTVLLTAAIAVVAAGCASVPECEPKPEWITSPETEGYYVGVGSADTGNPAEDRPVAEARARADLASRISAQVRSELEIATSESSAAGASQEVTEQVNQSVEANLQDIETVDAYHCPGEGYWVYVRLSRQRWEEIQEERRREITRRLQELVEPVLRGEDEDFLLELETLLQGRRLVYESTIGPSVKGTLAGQEGTLADMLEGYINRALSSLSMSVERETLRVPVAGEIELQGRVSSSIFDRIGNIEVFVSKKNGARLTATQTDEEGSFTVKLPEGFAEPGEQHVVLRPSFQEYEGEGLLPRDSLPSKEVVFSVTRVPVGLEVESSADVRDMDFAKQVKSLFSDRDLPLEFIEKGDQRPSLVVRFVVRIEDYPKLSDNAPDMARARAVVSFEREGKTLYSYESEWLKDGGLNPEQAHRRVTDKLFSELAGKGEMFEKLEQAVITR